MGIEVSGIDNARLANVLQVVDGAGPNQVIADVHVVGIVQQGTLSRMAKRSQGLFEELREAFR